MSRFLQPGPALALAIPLALAACDAGTGPPQVAVLEIEPAAVTLDLEFTQQFTTVQRDASGNVWDPQPVIWIGSSDQGVLQLGGAGLARAVGPGAAVVSAYVAGIKATASVTVPPLRFAQVSSPGPSCGITEAQLAYCWGENTSGQLGDSTTEWHPTPNPVAGGLLFRQISAAGDVVCALTPEGVAYCWGWGVAGALGDGVDSVHKRYVPTPVVGGHTFASVHVGGWSTCALTAAGFPYCWGGIAEGRSVPTPVVGGHTFISLSVGSAVCGVTPDGVAYCWGNNNGGQLGDGSTTDRSEPTPVSGGLVFQSISAGGGHTCGVGVGGAAFCWGYNSQGELGDGTYTDRLVPTRVASDSLFHSVHAVGGITCGLTTGSVAYCWGGNFPGGALGQPPNELHDSPVPVPVTGNHTFLWLDALCGKDAADELVYCWGGNTYGRLGIGTYTLGSYIPVPIFGQ